MITSADAGVIGACLTFCGYVLLARATRGANKKGDVSIDKMDQLLYKHERLEQALLDHTKQDEINFAELRRRGVKTRRGWLRLATALIFTLFR